MMTNAEWRLLNQVASATVIGLNDIGLHQTANTLLVTHRRVLEERRDMLHSPVWQDGDDPQIHNKA